MGFNLKLFFLFLLFMYTFTVTYYTFYGVSKSYNEYFCRQRRADKPDYFSETGPVTLLNFTGLEEYPNYFLTYKGEVFIFKSLNETRSVYDEDGEYRYLVEYSSDFEKFDGPLNFKYKKHNNYFELKCETYYSDYQDPDGKRTNEIENNITVFQSSIFINDIGFVKDDKSNQKSVFDIKRILEGSGGFDCKFEKSPETCSLKQTTSDRFYSIYLYFLATFMFVYILCNLDINDYLVLRIIHRIQNSLDKGFKINFCNPITGDPINLKRGDPLYKFSDTMELSQDINQEGLNMIRDLNGEYVIISDEKILVKKSKGDAYIINLGRNSINALKSYFLEISLDHKCCAVNLEETHYLTTEEVLKEMLNGKFLVKTKKFKDGFVLDIGNFELRYIRSIFDLSKEKATRLIYHNKCFFSGYNLGALEQCLKNKMSFYNRPKEVNNSQWKWYTSDFLKLVNLYPEENKTTCPFYKKIIDWRPSKALKETIRKENEEGIKVISLFKESEVTINLDSLDKKAIEQTFDLYIKHSENIFIDIGGFEENSSSDEGFQKRAEFKELVLSAKCGFPKESSLLRDKLKENPSFSKNLREKCLKGMKDVTKERIEKLEDSLPKTIKHLSTYKDILLKEVRTLSKPGQNKLSKLKKDKNKSKISEEEFKKREEKIYKEESVLSTFDSQNIFSGLAISTILKTGKKLVSLKNYYSCLSGLEEKLEKNKEDYKESPVKGVINFSKLVDKCLKTKKNNNKKKTFNKAKGKGRGGNIGKEGNIREGDKSYQTHKNKIPDVLCKRGFLSKDFNECLKESIKRIDPQAKESETGEKKMIRERSVYFLKNLIKKSVQETLNKEEGRKRNYSKLDEFDTEVLKLINERTNEINGVNAGINFTESMKEIESLCPDIDPDIRMKMNRRISP